MSAAPAKRPGRPPGTNRTDRTDMIRVRATPEQRAEFDRIGADAVRQFLDQSRKSHAR